MIAPMGGPLAAADFVALAARWIDRKTATQQFLRRVNAMDGSAVIGRNGAGDFAGLVIPNVWPGSDCIREYRLRRDHPVAGWRKNATVRALHAPETKTARRYSRDSLLPLTRYR